MGAKWPHFCKRCRTGPPRGCRVPGLLRRRRQLVAEHLFYPHNGYGLPGRELYLRPAGLYYSDGGIDFDLEHCVVVVTTCIRELHDRFVFRPTAFLRPLCPLSPPSPPLAPSDASPTSTSENENENESQMAVVASDLPRENKLSTGTLIGIIGGSAAAFGLLIGLIILRRHRQQRSSSTTPERRLSIEDDWSQPDPAPFYPDCESRPSSRLMRWSRHLYSDSYDSSAEQSRYPAMPCAEPGMAGIGARSSTILSLAGEEVIGAPPRSAPAPLLALGHVSTSPHTPSRNPVMLPLTGTLPLPPKAPMSSQVSGARPAPRQPQTHTHYEARPQPRAHPVKAALRNPTHAEDAGFIADVGELPPLYRQEWEVEARMRREGSSMQ